jgi:hypothetical protein
MERPMDAPGIAGPKSGSYRERRKAVRSRIKGVLTITVFAVFVLSLQGNGTDNGPAEQSDRIGPVYPIIEPDWSIWLPQQAQKRLNEKPLGFSKAQLQKAIEKQMPGIELPEVETPRTYMVDPSVQVSRPVTDYRGKIIVPAGGKINPLTVLPGFRPIVVVDGTKEGQIRWLDGVVPKTRPLVLLTRGDVVDLGQRFGMPVYPVPASLIDRFSIERVPVILTQDGPRIKVKEVVP